MTEQVFDTLILSDLHLGSEVSRAKDALKTVKALAFRRLILLGDIFSDLNFGRLKKEHWQFLSHIRKLSNPKRGIEVVWVEGNHDRGLVDVMSHLVGVKVYEEYTWEFQGVRHLAVHGHQFDRFVSNNAFLSGFGSLLYLNLQKIDFSRKRLSHFLDRMNSAWLRLSPNVCAGALGLGKARGAQRVFCGHTHIALEAEQDGVHYYNTGCWTDQRPSYITIDEKGVDLRFYEMPEDVDEPDSGALEEYLVEYAFS